MNQQMWLAAAVGMVVLVAGLSGMLRRMGRLAVRWGVALGVLWGLQGVGPMVGITLGFNAVNALVLGVLGVPGFGLLVLTQWVLR